METIEGEKLTKLKVKILTPEDEHKPINFNPNPTNVAEFPMSVMLNDVTNCNIDNASHKPSLDSNVLETYDETISSSQTALNKILNYKLAGERVKIKFKTLDNFFLMHCYVTVEIQ
jgi:hypothetical protein